MVSIQLRRRPEAVQGASAEDQPAHCDERAGARRVPRGGQQGHQGARHGRDRRLRLPPLPRAVQGLQVSVPRPLCLLPGHGGGVQDLRHGAQASDREHV